MAGSNFLVFLMLLQSVEMSESMELSESVPRTVAEVRGGQGGWCDAAASLGGGLIGAVAVGLPIELEFGAVAGNSGELHRV
jgi:hypothetical protein